MKTKRIVVPAALIVLILIALSLISPVRVGHAETVADPTATQQGIATTEKPPDPTPGPGVTETLEPTKTPPAIETTKPPDPTPEPGVTETLQPTKTDEPAITETTSPAPSATNTETVQSSETPSQTPTVGDTATSTDTAVVNLTSTSTQTPVSSLTPSPTITPVASTSTATVTASHTPNTPTVTATATVLPSVTPGTPAATGTPTPTNTPVPVDTATNTPATPVVDITPVVTNITGTVKVNAESYEPSGKQAYIVGLITFNSLSRRVPIGLGWLQGDRSFHHALNVAGRISDNDFGIHQKFMPELARLKPGAIVWIDDSKYQVQYAVKVVNKNQSVMDRLLAHWTTITTCTADWKSNLVFLLKPIDERMR